jgi:hypothetical protein
MGSQHLAGRLAWGYGPHEAPRGSLGHWVHINKGAIVNYQCVVPSTRNAGPRQARPAAGNPPYTAFVRSMHLVRRPRGRCVETRAGLGKGCVRAFTRDYVDIVDLRCLPRNGSMFGYVWPVRVTHWPAFFSVLILSATGYCIAHPFISILGPAKDHFVMGTVRAIHLYTAIVFTLAALIRIYWMYAGNRYARVAPAGKRRLSTRTERLEPTRPCSRSCVAGSLSLSLRRPSARSPATSP